MSDLNQHSLVSSTSESPPPTGDISSTSKDIATIQSTKSNTFIIGSMLSEPDNAKTVESNGNTENISQAIQNVSDAADGVLDVLNNVTGSTGSSNLANLSSEQLLGLWTAVQNIPPKPLKELDSDNPDRSNTWDDTNNWRNKTAQSIPCKRKHTDSVDNLETSNTVESSTNPDDDRIMNPDIVKQRRVEIYADDLGHKWYKVQGAVVTRPIIPKKVSEAFQFMPVYGRPSSRAQLEDFQLNKIREFVGCDLNDEEFDNLKSYCSPNHLKLGTELVMLTNIPSQGLLPNDIDRNPNIFNLDDDDDEEDDEVANEEPNLCINKKCKMRLDRDPTNQYVTKLKYRGLKLLTLTPDVDEDDLTENSDELLEPGKDLLLRIRIYRPFLHSLKDRPNTKRHSVFSHDLVMTGRQYLSELRDRLFCPNDMDLRIDVSEHIDEIDPNKGTSQRDLYPSGFLFINNVFYVDTRVGCHDTSEEIREWAAARGIGTFPVRDMLTARLDELVLKLGHPEVYMHQGDCEHLFIFSEIRLVNVNDPLKLSHYPCTTALSQNQTIYCTTCAEFGSKWIVIDCNRVPFNPAFFCEICLRWYLYYEKVKIDNFQVYSYKGNEINMLKSQS